MSSDKRVTRNTKSILALREYLRELIQMPEMATNDHALAAALSSQGSLAKYANPARNIKPSSLNTMKRIANRYLEGGFESIDAMRRKILESMTAGAGMLDSPKKTRRVDREQRIEELTEENRSLREDLLRFSSAVTKSLAQGRNYAAKSNSAAIVALCAREQRELLLALSLIVNKPPSNVVDIRHG